VTPPDPRSGQSGVDTLTYAEYLHLDVLLDGHRPRTDVPDEDLFIVTHQALELWFAQTLRELTRAMDHLEADRITAAARTLRRVESMVGLWSRHLDVLDTMPAGDFLSFRGALGSASGAQSEQFRRLEIVSGVQTRSLQQGVRGIVGASRIAGDVQRGEAAERRSLRRTHLEALERHGLTSVSIFSDSDAPPELLGVTEQLLSYDLTFNRWRYRHWQLVMHVVGAGPGTGGSSGLPYLQGTMDRWFFPELWSGRETAHQQDSTWPPRVVLLDGSTHLDRHILGGKAYGLQQMSALGLPVPPAVALTTEVSREFMRTGALPDETWASVVEHLEVLERRTGTRLGGTPPLIVSVRSGAALSMPGMMDTELNVGVTAVTRSWLEENGADPDVVATACPADRPGQGSARAAGTPRDEALEQVRVAVLQVLESWDSPRAQVYRRANEISDDIGTAVVIQVMVFGGLDAESGTGVYFTRNPVDGSPEPFGEWLACAAGEELVSGERTPQSLDALVDAHPDAYRELVSIGRRLERTRSAALEIEFTIESGELYLLQVREATGTVHALVHWAVDLVHEGILDVEGALSRIPPGWEPERSSTREPPHGAVLATGVGVSEGVTWGVATSDVDEACDLADRGEPVVLVRPTTSPHDIHGFLAARAVITERGGTTSHAAVVGRQMGLPCVVGCGDGVAERLVGRVVTVDAGAGLVHEGKPEMPDGITRDSSPQIESFLRWRTEAHSARPAAEPAQTSP
jgi:pyruvate, orthophosphate dikinase